MTSQFKQFVDHASLTAHLALKIGSATLPHNDNDVSAERHFKTPASVVQGAEELNFLSPRNSHNQNYASGLSTVAGEWFSDIGEGLFHSSIVAFYCESCHHALS